MPTPKQAAANRLNAQKSTGPKTREGKQKVAINALRHGLTGRMVVLPSEDLDRYRTHVNTLTASLKPQGPEEIQLASLIADDYWRLQRIHAIEDGIFAMQFAEGPQLASDPRVHATLNQAQAFLDHSRELERLALYEQRIQRAIKTATARLESLQADRRASSAIHAVVPQPHSTAQQPNGFEFATTKTAPIQTTGHHRNRPIPRAKAA